MTLINHPFVGASSRRATPLSPETQNRQADPATADSPATSKRATSKRANQNRSLAKSALALVTAALAATTLASPAVAQLEDHLKCFKIKDEKTFRAAAVTLDALVPQFGMEDCAIKGGAKEFCVPVSKTVNLLEGGSLQTVDGDDQFYSRLCYKLKCPRTELAPELIDDQFGSRVIQGFKASKICTPAVLDSFQTPPTTGTTTTTSTTTTSTTTSTSITLTTGTTTTTLASLDDTFDGVALDPSWTVLNPDLVTIEVSGGALHLEPTEFGLPDMWFNNGSGPLVYKEVTGDFDVRTVISTADAAMPASPPAPEYRLAGILARDPASTDGDRNTVHVALGSGSAAQGTSYEYKSTLNSVSDWAATPTALPDGELRLTRVGSIITMYWRASSIDAWTEIQSFDRTDLPATLQVGAMVYSASSPPGIRASFDEIVFVP